ncbi:hypothetical protein SAMN05444169_4747 [Bradyrhizobium erythrophlei]|uniref:Uncharacterized protein n=1 Tax=Bradyrhizobium erythrophlei TaxID=1437360 RepID=A0A1M5NMT0_9BRAD|nr:hypothetical protein SAMN05444169_4747 [Bradyrhizobium erythrophlei]
MKGVPPEASLSLRRILDFHLTAQKVLAACNKAEAELRARLINRIYSTNRNIRFHL